MYKLRALFLICSLVVFGVATSYADSLTENFNYGLAIVNSDWKIVPVASEGQITLTTNVDGTITATLTDYNGMINEVGIDNSCAMGCGNSGFTSSTFNTIGNLGDQFGFQLLSFWCADPTTGFPTSCGVPTVTWTISYDNGPVTSVYQLLGGTYSLSDFYLNDNNGFEQYGAGVPPYSSNGSTVTPEPGTFLLLASGLTGMLGAVRRKLRA
jgi:hypothetical protein